LVSRPSPFATLFPAEIVSVSTADGAKLKLFVKHLDERQAGHPAKQRPDREKLVYERLLCDARLPVPRYYGGRWDDLGRRGRIFLEFVDGWSLKYQDLEFWFEAARELAKLHAHFARVAQRLAASDFLLHLDALYFQQWAGRAIHAVQQASSRAAAELAAVMDRYGQAARLLERHAQTLVHNDLSPKNVIADRSQNPPRILLVDWEMAAVGCGWLDLVQLKDGLEPAADRQMHDVYCESLAAAGLPSRSQEELDRLLAACEAHMTLYRLARSPNRSVPIETIEQWCARAKHAIDRASG
jgi:aminoglycoside phosphotransferase (APT) family kinase protein